MKWAFKPRWRHLHGMRPLTERNWNVIDHLLIFIAKLMSQILILALCAFNRDRGAGGVVRGGHDPSTFRRWCSFLQRFYIKGLPNPAKLPELPQKFDHQIAGNRISKVPVFKIFRRESSWTALDGSRVNHAPSHPL